jgi:hypothetical protein
MDVINVITTTLRAFSKNVFDLVLNNNRLLFCFDKMGKYMEVDGLGKNNSGLPNKRYGGIVFKAGGDAVEESVSITETANAGFVDYDEDLDADETQVLNRAVFPWKITYAAAVYYRQQAKANSKDSEFRKYDLVDTLVKNAESTLLNKLGLNLFNVPTVNPKGFSGIPYLITDDGTTTGSNAVGGLSTATFPNWKNQFETIPSVHTPADLQQAMGRLWRKLRFGADVIVTTAQLYGEYEASLIANVRFGTLKQLQDAWFEYLTFHKAVVIQDDNCPENRMYFLNFRAMAFNVLGNDFITTPDEPEHPAGTQKYIWPLINDGNLSVRSRRDLGVLVVLPPED